MHPAEAIYQPVKGLKHQLRLHLELQRPATVNDAMRLAQAADSALYYTQTAYLLLCSLARHASPVCDCVLVTP